MFQKFKRSLRARKPSSAAAHDLTEFEQPVCHACGHHMSQPSEHHQGDEFIARPYEMYEPGGRESWNSSAFSDSGFGSLSSAQNIESMLQYGGGGPCTQSPAFIEPSSRRSTYATDIYPNEDDLELEGGTSPGPPRGKTTELSDLPPRSSTKTSQGQKPKSRYARLNELPAASSGALPVDFDADCGESQEEEVTESGEKRTSHTLRSLMPRPLSFKRIDFRRMKHETRRE